MKRLSILTLFLFSYIVLLAQIPSENNKPSDIVSCNVSHYVCPDEGIGEISVEVDEKQGFTYSYTWHDEEGDEIIEWRNQLSFTEVSVGCYILTIKKCKPNVPGDNETPGDDGGVSGRGESSDDNSSKVPPQVECEEETKTICVGWEVTWVQKVNTYSPTSSLNSLEYIQGSEGEGSSESYNRIPKGISGWAQFEIGNDILPSNTSSAEATFLLTSALDETFGFKYKISTVDDTPGGGNPSGGILPPNSGGGGGASGRPATTYKREVFIIHNGIEDAISYTVQPEDIIRVNYSSQNSFIYHIGNRSIPEIKNINTEFTLKSTLSGEGISIQNAVMSHPCSLPDVDFEYAKLVKDLKGQQYFSKDFTFKFEYDEEYNVNNLDLKIYAASDAGQNDLYTSMFTLAESDLAYGDNRYELEIDPTLPYGAYVLEVRNTKNEIFKLRFKHTELYNESP